MRSTIFIMLFFCLGVSFSNAQDVIATVTDESNGGANDGEITLVMNGGYGPFVFNWSGPNGFTANTKNISGLSPGQYCVTITDELCGKLTLCRIVKKCDPIVAVYTGVNCPYNSNGYMGVILSGTAPFTLEWSDGYSTTTNLFGSLRTGLDLGVYCVTVTNAAGCSEVMCRAVTSPVEPMQISANLTQPSCNNKGAITLGVTGGFGPYTYNWADNVNTKDRNFLSPGTYCVTVTDNKNCTKTACYTLNSAINNLTVNLEDFVPISNCSNASICDGRLVVSGSGGQAPYTYNWSGPNSFSSNQASISNLCKTGIYNVTVSDASGCTKLATYLLCCCNSGEPGGGLNVLACPDIPAGISIEASVNSATSASGGNITLFISGLPGGQPYSLVWKKDGQFFSYEKNINNLSPGTYCVTVKSGCKTASRCFTIVNCDNANILINGTVNPACVSYNVGSVSLNVSGGTGTYTYRWSNGEQNKNIYDLLPGTYTVTVKDENYCTATKEFTIAAQEITEQDFQCTRLTFCGEQVVQTQEFPVTLVYNSDDCRFARATCANGYIGPPIFMGSQLSDGPGGPFSCLKIERCMNGQIYDTHVGIPGTGTIGGISNSSGCPAPFCRRISFCFYPTLGGIDPNSVSIIGTGSLVSTQVTFCQDGGCTACNGRPGDLLESTCDGSYIGTTCIFNPCALTGEGTESKLSMDSIIALVNNDAIEQFKKTASLITQKIYPYSEDVTDRENGTGGMVTDKGRLQVSPNPFMDHLTITVYSMIGLESSNIELIDMNGKVVYQQELSLKKGENVYNIVLPEAMPSGVYILKETQANGVVNIEKLIKQ